MSVTFAPEMGKITGHTVMCMCRAESAPTFGDRDDAVAVLAEVKDSGDLSAVGCRDFEDCLHFGVFIEARFEEEAPEVNLANTNARMVLDALGLAPEPDGEIVGTCTAQDFLGRVLVATAVAPEDPGMPATEQSGLGGARLVDCGRAPGYVQDRLDALREVAEWAASRDRSITWA